MPNTYILFYKPYGVLCQFSSKERKTTLRDYLTVPQDVYPIGRLDEDSEGLLMLTNDKRWTEIILNPAQKISKTYLALIEGIPDEEKLERLRKGVVVKIKNKGLLRTAPCTAEIIANPQWMEERNPPPVLRKNKQYCWLRITVIEGKNRQIRKMTATIGHPTLRLVRTEIGNLSLKELKPGQFRFVTEKEFSGLIHEK